MDDAIFDCIPVVKFNNESKNKNDILTFVITHKIETAKENGIMFYQMVRWQKILLLMDIN